MPSHKDRFRIKSTVEFLKRNSTVVRFFAKIAWKEEKIVYLYFLFGVAISIISPFISVWGTKWFVDGITSGKDIYTLAEIVAFIVVGSFLISVIGKFSSDKMSSCIDKIDRRVQMLINNISMNIDFEDTENPEVLNQLQKAISGYGQVGVMGIANTYHSIISGISIIMGVSYLVLECSMLLLVVIVIDFAIMSILNKCINKIFYQYFPKTISKERGFGYITNSIPSYQYGKEIRIYNAGEMMLHQQKKVASSIVNIEKEKAHDIWVISRYQRIVKQVFTGIVYAILAVQAFMSRITLGEFSSLFTAVKSFDGALNQVMGAILTLGNSTKIMEEVINYLNRGAYKDDGDLLGKYTDKIEIEFKNVSFKYPRTDEYILKNINIKIGVGEHIAIVGENGTGKTTLIKLLCRLYKVDEGEILVNGKNINDYRFDEYAKLLSVVFQDFKMLAFTIRENITLEKEASNEELMELCRTGGIAERVDSAQRKLDTSIYKMFEEDGIEPSGGEAQKIAIVRALFKDAPIVILDEPTAALDPISEADIYSRFNSLVNNKTAIYISHRLSSCKFCDRIIVLADNTIIETGSHDELMNKNGLYAGMFNVQAKYYQ